MPSAPCRPYSFINICTSFTDPTSTWLGEYYTVNFPLQSDVMYETADCRHWVVAIVERAVNTIPIFSSFLPAVSHSPSLQCHGNHTLGHRQSETSHRQGRSILPGLTHFLGFHNCRVSVPINCTSFSLVNVDKLLLVCWGLYIRVGEKERCVWWPAHVSSAVRKFAVDISARKEASYTGRISAKRFFGKPVEAARSIISAYVLCAARAADSCTWSIWVGLVRRGRGRSSSPTLSNTLSMGSFLSYVIGNSPPMDEGCSSAGSER